MHTLARAYWRIMLGIVSLLVMCSIAFGIFVLAGVFDELADRGTRKTSGAAVPTLTRAQISEVLSGIGNRQSRFDNLKKSAPAIADPSR